jgi:hypothetical protein
MVGTALSMPVSLVQKGRGEQTVCFAKHPSIMGCYAVSATYVLDKQVIESMHAKYTAVEISARDTKDEKIKYMSLSLSSLVAFLCFSVFVLSQVFWGHHWFFLKSVILNLTGKKLFCSRLKKGEGSA